MRDQSKKLSFSTIVCKKSAPKTVQYLLSLAESLLLECSSFSIRHCGLFAARTGFGCLRLYSQEEAALPSIFKSKNFLLVGAELGN